MDVDLTPTERRFYDVLADWIPHPKDEFYAQLWDDQGVNKDSAVHRHISTLRSKLSVSGLVIETRGINGKTTYRLLRRITAGE